VPKIRIKSIEFKLSDPYLPGHILNLAEAQALNALRAENIRNNFAKRITLGAIGPDELARLHTEIAQYDATYSFRLREPRTSSSAMHRESCQVARDHLAAQGITQDNQNFEALMYELLEQPWVQAEAGRRIYKRTLTALAVEQALTEEYPDGQK
jgi:hypothetical protein